MGFLNKLMDDVIAKDESKFGTYMPSIMLHTGIPVFDYLNGSSMTTSAGKVIYDVGVDSGKSIMLVGKPGSGKSTLAMQISYEVSRKFEDGLIYVFDFEGGSDRIERFQAVTGASEEWADEHVKFFDNDIYTETVMTSIIELSKMKLANADKISIPNPRYVDDPVHQPKTILPPSFIIIDSVAMMRSKADLDEKNVAEDTMSANTAGARNAKNNKDFLVRIVQPCLSANIIVILVNHLNARPSMNGRPQAAETRFMPADETVSGGRAIQYVANLWINVTAGKKLDPEADFGVQGFIATLQIVKSRNAAGGNSANMVFSQAEGFDSDLSSFLFLKNNNLILGGGRGFYIDGLPDVKFSQKEFKDKLATTPKLRKRFDELVDLELKKKIVASSKSAAAISEQEKDKAAPVSNDTKVAG